LGGFKESLREHREILLFLLLMPAMGIGLSIPLILLRARRAFIAIPIIALLLVQYLLLVHYIWRRIQRYIST